MDKFHEVGGERVVLENIQDFGLHLKSAKLDIVQDILYTTGVFSKRNAVVKPPKLNFTEVKGNKNLLQTWK